MRTRTKRLKEQILKAKVQISKLFEEQCENGAQVEVLRGHGAAACGQFVGDEAKGKRQRGLHGSAAALRVLGAGQQQVLAAQLVNYLREREKIESEVQEGAEESIKEKCDRDSKNVIKIAEVLYSLSFVDTSVSETEDLVRQLASQLKGSMREHKGWSYFVDDENGPELLPTAYAVLGLATESYSEAEEGAKYLMEHLDKRYGRGEDIGNVDADIMIDVVCLYALSLRKCPRANPSEEQKLRRVFRTIWRVVKPVMGEELEQNVEYFYKKEKGCYVRVPWQLYLIALAAHHELKGAFSASAIQGKLDRILDRLCSRSFIYPHSGRMLSARTNAIAFEVLSVIEEEMAHKDLAFVPLVVDWLKHQLRSKTGRRILGVLVVVIGILIIGGWVKGGGGISELGPEVLGALWGMAVTVWVGRRI